MKFARYQHVERWGTDDVSGIEMGMCYVFPKIDGTNASLWWDDGLRAGSRNRELSLDNDNAGFYAWSLQQPEFERFFKEYPQLRLFGEWLVPHTLKTYHKSAWNKFYVFDVMTDQGQYLPYYEYNGILTDFHIEHIPPICKVDTPSYDTLVKQLEKNVYLIDDGRGFGEGIVIKNYDFRNKYGRVVWAKMVRNDFKAKMQSGDVAHVKSSSIIEKEIADKYVTLALAEKELMKIKLDNNGWNSRLIPRLLNTVYHCLVKEEAWEFVKEHRNPVIDFRKLYQFSIARTKELLPHIFMFNNE